MSRLGRTLGTVRRVSLLAALVLAGVLRPAELRGQGNCTYDGFGGECTIGNNATYAINLTITRAVRLALSSTSIALDAPVPDDFDAGFGQTTGPTLTVRSNSTWSVSIRTTQNTWTASPPPARPNKPSAELRWGTLPAGTFTSISTSAATVQTGGASAGTVIPLYFRVTYNWLLDRPGSYSLPVQVTIASP